MILYGEANKDISGSVLYLESCATSWHGHGGCYNIEMLGSMLQVYVFIRGVRESGIHSLWSMFNPVVATGDVTYH